MTYRETWRRQKPRAAARFGTAIVVGALALAGGCGASNPGDLGGARDLAVAAGDLPSADYPPGPFGTVQGSAITNLSFIGRRDANRDGVTESSDPEVTIRLSDYYANKTRKALFVDVSGEWCAPCKAAQPGLKKLFAAYEAAGGKVAFLEAVVQDNARRPASLAVSDRWASAFKLPFDMTPDSQGALGPYYNENALPTEFVVRTRDMSIVWLKNGPTESEVKAQIDAVLAE